MKTKFLFILAFIGLLAGLLSVYVYSIPHHPQVPVIEPASNPFIKGIYANGIVESDQASGANMNIYPEVSGTVREVLVNEGQEVSKEAPLFTIDSTLQENTVMVSDAQIGVAAAALKTAQDQYTKLKGAYDLHHDYVSQDELDNSNNAVRVAAANLELARRQSGLNRAMLQKYTVRAPADGLVMTLNAGVGNYVSSQGIYDSYTGGDDPAAIMSGPQRNMAVRAYVDEILVSQLPASDQIDAEMSVRGSDVRIPLSFVRVQPYVIPKISLSDGRQERVDVRVLPLLFRFKGDLPFPIYPGQLVDVYIKRH